MNTDSAKEHGDRLLKKDASTLSWPTHKRNKFHSLRCYTQDTNNPEIFDADILM